MKILLLTASHLCRNPRVVKEAATLGAAGYNVTVLTVSVSERFEQFDRELMRGQPFRREVLDLATPGAARFAQRATTWLARKLCANFGLESAQALGSASGLLRRARGFPADLTIVHTEIPFWCATHLLREGRRVAADFEDWYSEDLPPADRRSRPVGLLRQAESFALHHCSYVSTTSKSMANALAAAFGGPTPLVLRNVFPLHPRSSLDRPGASGPPSLVWFSQTIGPGRGLEEFLAAWSQTTRPSRVTLLGDARPDYRASLLDCLPSDRRANIAFASPVPASQLPDTLAGFDIGLALEHQTPPSRDLTITNKLLQYLNAGLAIVATGTTGQREVMQAAPSSGHVMEFSDPAAAAAQLDTLLDDPNRLRAMQVAARAAAKREFCWELESARLLDAVARALT